MLGARIDRQQSMTIFPSRGLAERRVEILGDLDDWSAVIVEIPDGKFVVEIRDEDGEFLGHSG